MRAFELRDAFGLENLHLVERPDPRPGPGQVLLAMRAASINYRDLMMVEGRYNPRQPLPLIPCSDGIGEVLELGTGVGRWKVGDRALPLFAQRWLAGEPTRERMRATLGGPLDGTLAEFMVVDEESLIPPPAGWNDVQAATLPCAGLTAWSAVVTEGSVRPGDRVLIQGSGGVSIFALQFARAAGARVIATTSSEAKAERLRSLGAEEVLLYPQNPSWGKAVRQWTGGVGVDLVVEVGGAGTMPQSIAATRPGGTIALIGVLAGGGGTVDLTPVLMQKMRIQGILVGNRDGFEAMNRGIEASGCQPAIDRVFAFEEAPAAFEHLRSGQHFGKICLSFPGAR